MPPVVARHRFEEWSQCGPRAQQQHLSSALQDGNHTRLPATTELRLSELASTLLKVRETSYVGMNDGVDQEAPLQAQRRCTNEMLRVCLDDVQLLQLLPSASEDFARRSAPPEATQLFFLASMMALTKKDGGVGCIETGTHIRATSGQGLQLVNLAKKWSQHAHLSSSRCPPRSGTDCITSSRV